MTPNSSSDIQAAPQHGRRKREGGTCQPMQLSELTSSLAKGTTRGGDARRRSMPAASIVSEIDRKVDMVKLERVRMDEGLTKFVEPQKALLKLIAQKRAATSQERVVK